ncbi:Tn3 family transposase [Streptomyces sp. MNP-20]|uniref:Tn3 family transposase n=1 Tax=Streptomyces sp. MNP-20 TaxID=2721165 RepID=UPI001551C71D|nr:Tn3 family transposase [Streptomyces sp. MNP-20]
MHDAALHGVVHGAAALEREGPGVYAAVLRRNGYTVHSQPIAAVVAPPRFPTASRPPRSPETRQLDLRPDSPAYATQLRLITARIIAAANGSTGSEAVRTVRVLPAVAVPAPRTGREALAAALDAPAGARQSRAECLPRGRPRAPYLRCLSDPALRRRVSAATDKTEAFKGFSQWIGFGNRGVIADNDPVEQEEAMKFNALLTSAVIFHNTLDIAEIVRQLLEEGWTIEVEDLARICPDCI